MDSETQGQGVDTNKEKDAVSCREARADRIEGDTAELGQRTMALMPRKVRIRAGMKRAKGEGTE